MEATSNITPMPENNDTTVLENRFNYIINKINLLKNDTIYDGMLTYNYSRAKLDLYKYYKQATLGDCDITEPSIDDTEAYSKWSAWNEAKNVTKKDAMISYINIYESHLGKINDLRINDLEQKLALLLQSSNTV
jgi:acyl-CoA-binding protein